MHCKQHATALMHLLARNLYLELGSTKMSALLAATWL